MGRSAFTVVCIFGFAIRWASCSFDEIHQFLVDNNHKHVNMFQNSTSVKGPIFKPKELFYSRQPFEGERKRKDAQFNLFLFESATDDLMEVLEIIGRSPTRKSLLVLDEADYDLNELKSELSQLELRAFFYVALPTRPWAWYQVISLSSGNIIQDINFEIGSFLIKETFNLEGLEVTSTSLSWSPYYTMDECRDDGLNCSIYGSLNDYMEILARNYNFSLISSKNMEGDWGTLPKDGPYNLSGTWGGVMGM